MLVLVETKKFKQRSLFSFDARDQLNCPAMRVIERKADRLCVGIEAKYLHPFDKDDSKGNRLHFLDYYLADINRMEYPLKVPISMGKTRYEYWGGKRNLILKARWCEL